MTLPFTRSVFLNHPFDDLYKPIAKALVFAVYDCGFLARSAREESDAGDVRIAKIQRIIETSRFAIHDISRVELDPTTNLPRFNMPYEFGLWSGCKSYGAEKQRRKACLVLDKEPYRFQKFMSDIAGQDIEAHQDDPETAIKHVRDFLRTASGRNTIPGSAKIVERYRQFVSTLPALCKDAHLEEANLTYRDYAQMVEQWLAVNLLAGTS